MTVGLAGLVQGGGFGSFSKHYGLAAGSLLEAEVVTADGQIRIANACTNSDLFWALKGGGGSTFGVVSKMTLRVHELPEFFGPVNMKIKASSDDAYRRLTREFVSFYREHLFNDRWGEQARFSPDNTLEIAMLSLGMDKQQATKVWQPFVDWVKRSSGDYSFASRMLVGTVPARHWWDMRWWKERWPEILVPNPNDSRWINMLDYGLVHLIPNPAVTFDPRPGNANNAWWSGNTGECGWFIWAYQSLWLPESLLVDDQQEHLADALFAASRHSRFALHFNKGLAGAPPEAIAAGKDTAMNPAVLTSFALVIAADGQDPAYPGIPGHEPSVAEARQATDRITHCIDELRAIASNAGAYVSESDYFEKGWQQTYWGSNYPRLLEIKKKYDSDGLFFVHNGVGSEPWSPDGFTRLTRSARRVACGRICAISIPADTSISRPKGSTAAVSTTGSGSHGPMYSSYRARAEVSMSRQIRVVVVIRNALGFDTLSRSARCQRKDLSCTASSASAIEPSMRYMRDPVGADDMARSSRRDSTWHSGDHAGRTCRSLSAASIMSRM